MGQAAYDMTEVRRRRAPQAQRQSQQVRSPRFRSREITSNLPKTRPVRSSGIVPLCAVFFGMHPQFVFVFRFKCFELTVISLPQSQRQRHAAYLFTGSSAFFMTVSSPNLRPVRSSYLAIPTPMKTDI